MKGAKYGSSFHIKKSHMKIAFLEHRIESPTIWVNFGPPYLV